MIVHFSQHFDGMQPSPPETAVGVASAGPQRLLCLLEQQLGLPTPAARPGEALLAYQSCLEDLDSPTRFYHASLAVDGLGVARTLLGWRAAWYEAGWRGELDGSVSRRLADLAEVEALARERVPPCDGQRLVRIAHALDSGLVTQIERIVLHDEPDALSLAWRRVLAHFDCVTAEGVAPTPQGEPGTDLHAIQRLLFEIERGTDDDALERIRENDRLRPIRLRGDDSLIVVKAVSRDLSAQTIAEHVRALDRPVRTVLIAERDGIIVDNALERVGLPRAGFQHHSRFRAVTQVLKLVLSLVWKPLGPRALLQFLLHPVGPLPRHARSLLADAVAAEPGVGGRAWQATLERIAERAAENANDGDEGGEKLVDDIRWWLECERYAADRGAPIPVLVERAQRTAAWLVRRANGLGDRERELYAAAIAQCEALIDALGRLAERGHERVPRLVLERLVDEVSGASPDPSTFAEAGHVRATTSPAAITEPWDTVIWWDLAPRSARVDYPWSDGELAELRAAGIALPAIEDVIRHESRAWTRPVLNAKRQLVLVVHESDEGSHPLWTRLSSLAEGFREVRVEDALLGGEGAIPALGVPLEPQARIALPEKRRWWQLPADVRIPRREAESYSSLKKLVDYPHQWVLHYAARLEAGRAANIAEDVLLYGQLAHRVFEQYFARFPDGRIASAPRESDDAVLRWLARELPPLIEREAAVLDEPGMGVVRERVITTIERALPALLRHLEQARIVRVVTEAPHDVPFDVRDRTLQLRGSIDLLLTDAKGREIVLDVKWGGQDYRGKELAGNRALQLATYAYMRSRLDAAHRWPAQAFFIVETCNIVAADDRIFPEAVIFSPQEALQAEEVWRRVVRAYDWRMEQLDRGLIEVNVEGTEADERSIAPEDALRIADRPDRYDDFKSLVGWEIGE